MNKEKIIKFFKNPFNVLFIILLIITIIIYSKDLFVDSIWLDETSYMWDAQLIKQNPLHLLKMEMYYLPDLIITFYNLFFKSFIAGRLMGLTFGLLGMVLVFIIGKKIKDSFVGFTAALLLAFHHWYRFLTMKALTDVPTSVMLLWFAYLLYLFEIDIWKEKKNIKLIIAFIIIGFFTLTVKASGMFVIPFTILYLIIAFLLKKDKKEKINYVTQKLKKKIILIPGIIIAIICMYYFYKIIYPVAKSFVLKFQFSFMMPTLSLLPNLLSWTIIVLFIMGVIFTIIYKKKKIILISLIPILFLFFVVFFTDQIPELRYILPIILPIYIISALVIDEIISYILLFINKRYIKSTLRICSIIIVLFIIVKPYYSLGNQIIENKNWAYTGYIEAMNWVSDNIKTEGNYVPDFYACCGYNVGLDRDDIRRVNWSGYFDTFEEFKVFIERENNLNKTIYLMPDVWEPGQRSWLYPMTQEKFNNIISLGFNLVKVVERPYPTNEGIKNIPAILIFRRN